MTFYEELVMQTQTNFSKYYGMYASGKTPYILTKKKPLPYSEQISRLAVRPGCQRQAAEIFTMKIMLPIGSILEGLQKSTDFMARLLECNTHSRPERNTGDMWRPS